MLSLLFMVNFSNFDGAYALCSQNIHSDEGLHIHQYGVFFYLGKNDPILMDMQPVI